MRFIVENEVIIIFLIGSINYCNPIDKDFLYLYLVKKIVYIALAMLMSGTLNAQYNWDIGGKIGASNYLGEFGGEEETRKDFISDMKLSQTRWTLGAFGRYRFNPYVALNIGLSYIRIQGADSLSTNRGRVGRNLHFKNDMFELTARAEGYFYSTNDLGGKGRYRTDMRMFAFFGIGGLYHNPKAKLGSTWYALRPLKTEGVSYNKLTMVIPAGLGINITFRRKHRIGLEMGWRTTFTDYLDDASTSYIDPSELEGPIAIALANRYDEAYHRDPDAIPHAANYEPGEKRGDPTHNDSYLTTVFTYSYVIRGRSNFYRQKYGWLTNRRRRGRRSRAKF